MKLRLILASFLLIFVSQTNCGDRQPLVYKYSRNITRKVGQYSTPLLVGTEDAAAKVGKDVQHSSLVALRAVLKGLITANQGLHSVLRYAQKASGGGPPPPPE